MQTNTQLFNINFYNKPLPNLLNLINKSINAKEPLFVTTVNASFLVNAFKDPFFYKLLKQNKVNLVDGVGVQLAGEYLSNLPKILKVFKWLVYLFLGLKIGISFLIFDKKPTYLKYRVTGVRLTKKLLSLCQNNQYSICIIHKKNSLLSYNELHNYLSKNFNKLKFKIYLTDSVKTDLNKIPSSQLYFCTLGEVAQEKLLYRLYKSRPNGIFIGVGSTFDLLSHKIPSVPIVFKSRGLEWFYRLLTRPKRAKKIFRSVVVFPLMVYKYSLFNRQISI